LKRERNHDVKKSKYTEQQIAFALKQAELGTSVEEVCRKMGYQRCHLLQLEEEVRWAKSIRAQAFEATGGRERQVEAPGSRLSLDKTMLQDVLSKKVLKPFRKCILFDELCDHYRASAVRANPLTAPRWKA
jgi:putative transposase